jgi:hypothetical protein
MTKTQAYLTEKEKSGIKATALSHQSSLTSQATDKFQVKTGGINKASILDSIAGIWSDRNDTTRLRSLRAGWRRRQTQRAKQAH